MCLKMLDLKTEKLWATRLSHDYVRIILFAAKGRKKDKSKCQIV